MSGEAMRERIIKELNEAGFKPAPSLPLPDLNAKLRPASEIAERLLALRVLILWVTFPVKEEYTKSITAMRDEERALEWLTAEETPIVMLERDEAQTQYMDWIGWKMENVWSLAWVLGFEQAPTTNAYQVDGDVIVPIINEFIPAMFERCGNDLSKLTARPVEEVVEMEYRFYCAHNAVRSAQMGYATVPEGFHPIGHGGCIHERRHSLSWCLAPEVTWDETDLST